MNPTFCSVHSCKVSYWNGSDVVLLCATVGLLTWTGAVCKLRPLRFPLGNGGSPKSENVSPIIDLPWGWFLIGYISLTKGGHFRQRLTTCRFGRLTLKTLLQSRSRPSCAPTPLPSLLGGIQPGVCSSGDVVQTDYPIIQNRMYVLQIPLFLVPISIFAH